MYQCRVNNCGGGKCIHKLLEEKCPHCSFPMVEVTTTGYRFCSSGTSIYACDYGYNSIPVEGDPVTETTPKVHVRPALANLIYNPVADRGSDDYTP